MIITKHITGVSLLVLEVPEALAKVVHEDRVVELTDDKAITARYSKDGGLVLTNLTKTPATGEWVEMDLNEAVGLTLSTDGAKRLMLFLTQVL